MEEEYLDEIRKMKNQCDEVLKNHSEKTDTKRAHYHILAQKDDADTANITSNFQEIDTLKRDIKEAKIKHEKLTQTNEKEIQTLKEEKDDLRKEHRKFREKNERILAKDHEQLKLLSDLSNQIIKVTYGFLLFLLFKESTHRQFQMLFFCYRRI